MAIEITKDHMSLAVNGRELATAKRTGDLWTVSTWPASLSYNQAITALTLAERLAYGYGDDDPFVTSWREEMAGA